MSGVEKHYKGYSAGCLLNTMNIRDLAPFLDGIVWRSFEKGYPKQSVVVNAGEPAIELVNETDIQGWLWSMSFGADDPNMELSVKVDEYEETDISAYNLYTLAQKRVPGNTWYSPQAAGVGSYNLCLYEPSGWFPIRKNLRITVKLNPQGSTTTANLLVSRFEVLRIENKNKFLNSLADFKAKGLF